MNQTNDPRTVAADDPYVVDGDEVLTEDYSQVQYPIDNAPNPRRLARAMCRVIWDLHRRLRELEAPPKVVALRSWPLPPTAVEKVMNYIHVAQADVDILNYLKTTNGAALREQLGCMDAVDDGVRKWVEGLLDISHGKPS